ncbi:hypothetical protein MSIBF_A1170003 [groundwater metagenome]|uniref:Uncharacterized protein n=1 Tax=groundwater metagenome TaxID=717931 RepID=A0A098E6R3_9ZZZZ
MYEGHKKHFIEQKNKNESKIQTNRNQENPRKREIIEKVQIQKR